MANPRAIRFTDHEQELIEEFLKNNPLFDFSSLARMAILDFIHNPKVKIRPVKDTTNRTERRTRGQPEQ